MVKKFTFSDIINNSSDFTILKKKYKITNVENGSANKNVIKDFNITLEPKNKVKRNVKKNYNPNKFEEIYKQSKGFTSGHIQYQTYYTSVKLIGIKTVKEATELFGFTTEKNIRMTFANQKYKNYKCDIIVDVSKKYRHYYFKYDKSIDYNALIDKFVKLQNCKQIKNNISDEKYDYIIYEQNSDNNYFNIFEVQINRSDDRALNNEVNNVINQSNEAKDALQGNLNDKKNAAARRLGERLVKRAAAKRAKRLAIQDNNNLQKVKTKIKPNANKLYEGVCIKF